MQPSPHAPDRRTRGAGNDLEELALLKVLFHRAGVLAHVVHEGLALHLAPLAHEGVDLALDLRQGAPALPSLPRPGTASPPGSTVLGSCRIGVICPGGQPII